MLVLRRSVGQEIVIGNNISIMVTELRNGWVKIGVQAPRDVRVHRKEVYELIQQQDAEQFAGMDQPTKPEIGQ